MPLGIPKIFDKVVNGTFDSQHQLVQNDNEVSLLRSRIRRERRSGANRYVCDLCREPIYVTNAHGTPHFAHYSDSGPYCFWRTLKPSTLEQISATRFRGKQVGELHVRLILALEELCKRHCNCKNTSTPDETYFGKGHSGHRFPDLQTTFIENKIAFELQISSTYLPVISDREDFYRENNVYLIWLTHNFELNASRQTEKDIVAVRSRQILEVNDRTIVESFSTGEIYFLLHWQQPNLVNNELSWSWCNRQIKISDLIFDTYLFEARAVDPWQIEAELIRKDNCNTVCEFEKYWNERNTWDAKLAKRIAEHWRLDQPIDECQTGTALKQRALKKIFSFCDMAENAISISEALGFDRVLDRFLFLRDGINSFNKQTEVGVCDTILENWPNFTDSLFAIAVAYKKENLIGRPVFLQKAKRALAGEIDVVPTSQCHDFDSFLAVLFPKAASYLRASALPYVQFRIQDK